jgi:hypothetical protein
MKKNRFALYASCLVAALVAATACCAQSPFNGTWKTDTTQTKWDPKPIVFYTSQGWYHCLICNPTYDVAADGQDHAVTGQSYDTVAISIVDPNTISLTYKKNGKVITEQTRTVSADGKTLSVHSIAHPKDTDKTMTFEIKARRDGAAHPGVHATSGRWILTAEKGSDEGYLTTYKVDGDQISMSQPDGENYTATLGGGDAPYKGAHSIDAVSVRRLNPNTIEETDKRGGRDIEVYTMTVSPSGKTMTIVDEEKVVGRTTHLVAKKQ